MKVIYSIKNNKIIMTEIKMVEVKYWTAQTKLQTTKIILN
jgi:hypothetical protein